MMVPAIYIVLAKFPDQCHLRGGVYFVDTIPTTGSGKVLHREARKMATKLYEESIQCNK